MREKYIGPISKKNMSKAAFRAYKALYGARKRSRDLGQPINIDSREFIFWYMSEQQKNNFKCPSLSRYDHSKPYTWDNFRLEEQADNSRESFYRNNIFDHTKKPIHILNAKDGSILITCPSVNQASMCTKMNKSYISDILRKSPRVTRHKRKYFDFKYAEKS